MRLADLPLWHQLHDQAIGQHRIHLRQLFAEDPQRFSRFSLRHNGLLLDFSKQRITADILSNLRGLAREADLAGWLAKMHRGEKINHTEGRAVRHMELRLPLDDARTPPEVSSVRRRMETFCNQIHGGVWRGFSGDRITDVVNLGIGGSDLGPCMVATALSAWHQPDLKVHFVSNVDGADLAQTLAKLNPRTTLFIIASKTFTTLETMRNAQTARDWVLSAAHDDAAIARHFVAVSTNLSATRAFGILPENVFEFWDWVGGRFSLWSAIGLSVALAIGYRNFEDLLAGAHDMDRHFCTAPAEANLPLTSALISLWNTNFLGAETQAVLPYSQSLAYLPAHLQQLVMESLGKQVNRKGQPVGIATSPVLWGEAGTNGQHSFFQLFHQGGRLIPCDFIVLREADFPLPGHHPQVLANCLAQSAALAFGQTAEEARAAGVPEEQVPYRVFPGNQPSTTLVLPRLSPFTLGQLAAMYEHKVFCLGVLWNINPFDQWGVELGKQLASRLTPLLTEEGGDLGAFDGSTRGLLNELKPA